jgi:hypothetical protein
LVSTGVVSSVSKSKGGLICAFNPRVNVNEKRSAKCFIVKKVKQTRFDYSEPAKTRLQSTAEI